MFHKKLKIPSLLHDIFGEWQTPANFVAVTVVVGVMCLLWWQKIPDVALWRQVTGGLLILDIAAGAVANFTRGTNDYYKTRPFNRYLFLSIHWHVLIVAWLFQEPLLPYLAVSIYTLVAALVVNQMMGHPEQTVVGGFFVCLGLVLLTALPLSQIGQVASLLFVVKVVFSFGVDHYAESR